MHNTIKILLSCLLLMGPIGNLLAAVDLKVAVNSTVVKPGDRVDYTLTVTNTDSSPVNNVTVQDLFPASMSVFYVYIPDGGTCPVNTCQVGERITWNIGTLAANTSRTIRFEATVNQGGTAPADGAVLSNLAELFINNVSSATRTTDVTAQSTPGLVTSMASDRDPVVTGENMSYRITYGNAGTTNVLNTQLRAPIPVGTTFVSASQGGTQVGNDVVWSLGTVLAGTSGERSFSVTVNGGNVAGDALEASAQLEDSGTSSVIVGTQHVTRLAAATPVQLVVTTDTDHVTQGDTVKYSLTVTNTSSSAVTGVVVDSMFADNTSVFYVYIPDGGTCPVNTCNVGERITWNIGTLAANSSQTVHYEATIDAGGSGAVAGMILSNESTLRYDGGSGSETTDILVQSAAGLVASIASDRNPVVAGENLSYRISYGNAGTTNVLNTQLRASIPAGTTFVSATQGGTQIGNDVVWTLGTALAGTGGERSFTVTVNGGNVAGDVVETSAHLEDNVTSHIHISSQRTTQLVAATPVQLIVTTDKDHAAPGDTVKYSLTVTNTTSSPVTGVTVDSLFADNTSVFYVYIPDGGTCPVNTCNVGERITWNIGTLAANTSKTVNFEATVDTGGSGAVDGMILSYESTLAYTGGSGSDTTNILVKSTPGLVTSIAPDRNPVVAGENLSYRITYGNAGSTNVLNTRLRAPIPVGTAFVSASQGGTQVGNDVVWTLGTVLAGVSGERSFTVTVNAGNVAGDALEASTQLEDSLTSNSIIGSRSVTRLATSTPVQLIVTTDTDHAAPGDTVKYSLTVTNTTSSPVTGVVVDSRFAAKTRVNYLYIQDGGTCPVNTCNAGERISWNIGSLAANTSKTVRYEATINTGGSAAADGSILTTESTLEYVEGEGSSETTDLQVQSTPGLATSIVSDRNPVVAGENIGYHISFGNAGTTNVMNTRLRAPIPAGTSFVSATQGGTQVGNDVVWTLGTVLAGAGGERSFSVSVNGSAVAGDAVQAITHLEDSGTLNIIRSSRDVTRLATSTPVQLFTTSETIFPGPGGRIEHTLTVTNTSSSPVTGVVVDSLFSPETRVNYLTISDGGTCPVNTCNTGERVSWNIGSIAGNSSHTVRYESTINTAGVAPADGSVIRNLATLKHDTGDASVAADIVVNSAANLQLSIEADKDPVIPGENLTYRIMMGNQTASTASGLLLRAPIPAGTSFVSASPGFSVSGGYVQWVLKSRLVSGAYDERSFTVTVSSASGDALQGKAELLDSASAIKWLDSETVTAVQATIPVRMSISAIPDPQVTGGMDYIMIITNTTNQPVTGVVVQNLIPEFMTVSNANIQDSGVCPGGSCQADERISWTVGTLAAQAVASVQFKGVLFSNSSAPVAGTLISDQATLVTDINRGSIEREIGIGTDIDIDRDALPDAWEVLHFGNTNMGTNGDSDQDGLTNFTEYQIGTAPELFDTDGDGMDDGYEVAKGFNPLSPADAALDPDIDGFTNLQEYQANTNPLASLSRPGDDVVIDFGGIGLWARSNDVYWLKLNNTSPDDVVTGDIDGNGIDDVIADFASTLGGIFIKRNGGAWTQLHNFATDSITTGDLDGNGQDDIVIDFGGIGLWARMNDASWLKLNNSSPDQVVITDMDGNGADDVIADFGSTFGGLFVKRNGGAWAKLHNTSPVTMGVGDLDGNGSGDVIINFGGIGLWARMNNTSWLKLHNGSPDSVVAGDVDGNGADDVVASFGSSFGGVWQKLNLGGWTKLNNNAPDQMVMGDVDASGQSDLIGAFNSTLGGIFVRRNNGAWAKLHNSNPDDLASGDIVK